MAAADKSRDCIDLSGSTYCIVTGASKGIGRAISIELSKQIGPKSLMLLIARDEAELNVTADLCRSENVEVVVQALDLSVNRNEKWYEYINNSFGPNHSVHSFDTCIIVHNVGSLGNLTVETTRIEDVTELGKYYDLNVFNVIALNTQFLKFFEAVEENLVIVNITSLCAIKPMSGMAYYCSGKAAREMFFRVLAEEKKNIRVLNYAPGPVQTAMIDYVFAEATNENLKEVFHSLVSQNNLLTPEATAQKCLKVLKLSKFSPGQHVDYFDDEN